MAPRWTPMSGPGHDVATSLRWAQWDWSPGPFIDRRATSLFCAWYGGPVGRRVDPDGDHTTSTLSGCLEWAIRLF